MEAQKLKQKKPSISKGKIKKTIKNVICRPDPVFWPLADEEETTQITSLLKKHSVHIPEFKKLPWKELKLIPKDKRPKQPPIERVSGLTFGISECRQLIEKKECSALLIEASVNPRTIVQPVISHCLQLNIPVLCLQGLRTACAQNFGIPTTCLGVQTPLDEIINKTMELFSKKQPKSVPDVKKEIKEEKENNNDEMEVETLETVPTFSYLYRTSKKSRMFIPSNKVSVAEFAGQQYIQFSNKDDGNEKLDRKKYMGMLLKRISNNPNKRKLNND
ncbi:uncharacterized protein LOC121735308 [Aricia agestis]|uniref:uncharacterized protein LOC121735308 n=1 Tax=Aricia agestis TaxID=91739 RepID=UPI001C206D39|nr:uncharacterized protein LOC121735308 [Aricia agestis]